MKLKVLLPTHVLLEEEVTRVVAEAENGSFAILPRHIDFVAPLVAGLVVYELENGAEKYLGADVGLLVKRADEVLLSTRNAFQVSELGEIRRMVDEEFRRLDEKEKEARNALAKLEADFVRRFIEWGRQ
jgi:F-type H+-transporting ATPase subunit epsilon